jgi:hypothetical protein
MHLLFDRCESPWPKSVGGERLSERYKLLDGTSPTLRNDEARQPVENVPNALRNSGVRPKLATIKKDLDSGSTRHLFDQASEEPRDVTRRRSIKVGKDAID